MFQNLVIAFRNVLANKRRSFFIGGAVALGTIIMLLTASLSNGIRYNMVSNAFALFTGHINIEGIETVRGYDKHLIPDSEPIVKTIHETIPNAKILKKTLVTGRVYNPAKSVSHQGGMVFGMNIDKEKLFREFVTVISGDIESIKKENTAIIGVNTANKFDLKVGERFTFEGRVDDAEGFGMSNKTVDFTVGAIIQGMSMGPMNNLIRVSNQTARDFAFMKESQVSQLMVYIDDKYRSVEYADKLEEALRQAEYEVAVTKRNEEETSERGEAASMFGSDFSLLEKDDGLMLQVKTWQEEISFLEEMIRTVEVVAFVINVILMAIILIGISIALTMSIKERTNEIGTLRAIGMQKPSILSLFIYEGMILGLMGAFLGLIIGGSISVFFTYNGIYVGPSPVSVFLINNSLYLRFTAEIALAIISIMIVFAGIASIYPSFQATKLKPVTAMQKE